MEVNTNTIIGQLVAQDYRAAEIFSHYKIDFCCKGNLSIGQACEKKKLEPQEILKALEEQLYTRSSGEIDYQAWPLDLLADYIEKKHHRYVSEKTPILQTYLKKISSVHGGNHPELFEIATEFDHCAGALAAHMKKEELILFPQIRKLVTASINSAEVHHSFIQQPINVMEQEHETEGERFRKIAELSTNYTPPSDACSTYRVAFALLKEFENDLHLHIHLENNILFPKALELAESVSRKSATLLS